MNYNGSTANIEIDKNLSGLFEKKWSQWSFSDDDVPAEIILEIFDTARNVTSSYNLRKLDELTRNGYTVNFKVNGDGALDDGNGNTFTPSEVQIDDLQRYENTGISSDAKVLYALKTDSGLQGRLVNGLAENESKQISEFIDKGKMKRKYLIIKH